MNKSNSVSIEGRLIGPGEKCFIIAEAGSNHNGDLKTAFNLVDIAVEAGADCVKFQSVSFDTLTSDGNNADLKKAVDQITLDRGWYVSLIDYCKQKGIIFLSTPTYESAVDELDELGVSAFKVASMDLTNIPLIRYIARKGKVVIISRGMANVSEIDAALSAIKSEGNEKIILLHCVADYPSNPEAINLNQLLSMNFSFDAIIGFSDHSESESIPSAAVALGAAVIEKHFTYDRSIKGFDHFYAMDPKMLKRMISGIRDTEKAMGSHTITFHESELEGRSSYRRSIVLSKSISKGEVVSAVNLTTKRPGTGISPIHWDIVLGKKANKSLEKNHILSLEDLY